MKTSFQQADEIKDARDKGFLDQFERMMEDQEERDEQTRQWSEQFEKNLIAQELCDIERRIMDGE